MTQVTYHAQGRWTVVRDRSEKTRRSPRPREVTLPNQERNTGQQQVALKRLDRTEATTRDSSRALTCVGQV